MCKKVDNKNKKHSKLKLYLRISISVSLFLATVLLIMWFILLKDPNRNNHVRSELTASQIIEKNYIKGFENTKNTGKFSYILSEDDINDLLFDGVKELNDKHVESICFEYSQNGQYTFFVDFKNTFIKTRAVVTTYVEDYGYDFADLKIVSVKMGKIESSKLLVRKGYLTSDWINEYFKDCHLPITYNEKTKVLHYEVGNFFNEFPETKISKTFFNLALQDSTRLSVDPSNLGFVVDFSKLRSKNELIINASTTPVPNFYNELKDACEVEFAGMSFGDKKMVYSINVSDVANVFKSSIPSTLKESIGTVYFDLVDAQPSFKEGKVDITLLFSLNGYLIDQNVELSFNDFSDTAFYAEIEVSYSNNFLSEYLEQIFGKIAENYGNFFSFSDTQGVLSIDIANMFADPDIDSAFKTIEINPLTQTIDFSIERTTS